MIKYIHYGADYLQDMVLGKGYSGDGWSQYGYTRYVFPTEYKDRIDAWEILEEIDGKTAFTDLREIRERRFDEEHLYVETREMSCLIVEDAFLAVDTPERVQLNLYEVDELVQGILSDKMGIISFKVDKEACYSRYFVYLPADRAKRIESLIGDWLQTVDCPYCTHGKNLASLMNMADHDEAVTLKMVGSNMELSTTYGPLTLTQKIATRYCPMCGKEL